MFPWGRGFPPSGGAERGAEVQKNTAQPNIGGGAPGAALADKPGLRPGVTAEAAADLLFGLLGPQLYLLFVRDRGWTPDRWQDRVLATLTARLCTAPDTGAASS
ncbi:hypothetical protein SUDANB121_00246 [Nocardiopsis dassonvillei]|uniref:hypothetical protein n=1 Tax=Nocardiopsis dassonvillei TaxID=2014 RepID=UPI003F572D8E